MLQRCCKRLTIETTVSVLGLIHAAAFIVTKVLRGSVNWDFWGT